MRRNQGLQLALVVATAGLALPAAAQSPPPPLPIGPVSFPPFAERTLRNGAQLIVVENHEQPVVSVNVYMRSAGASAGPDEKPVASLTASLLDNGTRTRTAKEIVDAIDGMGAQLGATASNDWATVTLTALRDDLDAALDLLADVILNPVFPADELETERRRLLSSLQVELSQPVWLSYRQFMARVFGSHPYGRLNTAPALRSITREDLVAFHDAYYRPGSALFVVAGDVNTADVTSRLQSRFAGWTGSAPARQQVAAAPTLSQREIVLVDKPGAVQASFRIGHTIVPATHPDWPALTVATSILGGGTKGWLYTVLREQKGFTYGANAFAVQRMDPGFFQMQGDVRNEVADSALALFIELSERLRNQPVPAADLAAAKSFIAGGFPLTIETPGQVASQVASARLLGQGKDHVKTWRQRIAAVKAADVQRVARAHLHPDHAVIVVSGDAAVLKPKLEKFGKLTVVDAEGKPR